MERNTFRISINLNAESYEYLVNASKTKKRQIVIQEAINLHRNESLQKQNLDYLRHEIMYVKLDLESKKELLFSLNESPKSENIQMRILHNFLENLLEKLEMLLRKTKE